MGWFKEIFGGNKGVLGHHEATTVEIYGRPLRCIICGHRYFWHHDVMLNTRMATVFDLDWMNQSASCAVCDHCGYMHWFIPPAEDTEDIEKNEWAEHP